MKEFNFTLGPDSINGLRKHHSNPRNSGSLIQCLNVEASEGGLIPITLVTNPTTVIVSWPFPQLFIGGDYSLLCQKDIIYKVNADWSLTELLDLSGISGAWEDRTWHLANFGVYFLLTNGYVIAYYDIKTETFLYYSTDQSHMPLFKTVCNFRGQAIAGNISESWYNCGDSFVIWSRIGSADFLPNEMNTSGFMPMPWEDEIYKVLPLHEGVIVYGNRGIGVLLPKDITFGLRQIASYGIMNREAVDGDLNNHVFIDSSGFLRRIKSDFTIEKLGYQEFFEDMADDDPIVTHEGLNNHFYISEGTNSFLLTDHGLSNHSQALTNVAFVQGGLVGTFTDLSLSTFQLVTDIFDMKIRGFKTITTIEFGLDSDEDCYIAVDWRVDKKSDWTRTGFVIVNNQGITSIPCSGAEFRLVIKSDSYVGINLDYINVRFKVTDKRAIRGVYSVT